MQLIDAAVMPLLQRPPVRRRNPQGRVAKRLNSTSVQDTSNSAHASEDQQAPAASSINGGSSPGHDGSSRACYQNGHRSPLAVSVSEEFGSECDGEEEWELGPRRIAPAVESLAVLARNNPQNRYSKCSS